MAADDLEIVELKSQKEWERWLKKNSSKSKGVWLRFFKKDSGVKGLTYTEALDESLCYGWIDGQVKKFDEKSWVQKFTPRRSKSVWSKRNTEHVERLIKAGKMTPSGMKEVELAKADGRWQRAYDSPASMQVPEDFLKELSKDKKAKAFFDTLNRANHYGIAWRLQTAAKPETREKRMKALLEMLRQGKKLH